jgi:hypothetical protein
MKLVRESITDILKPKEEVLNRYNDLKKNTDDFMTKLFSDMHKDNDVY